MKFRELKLPGKYLTAAAGKIYESAWYQRMFAGNGRMGEKLRLLHPEGQADTLLEAYHCRKIRELLLGLFLVLILFSSGMAVYVSKRGAQMTKWVERPGYEEGDRKESWEVIREDGIKEKLELTVTERQYTAQEAQEKLRQAEQELEACILGENESEDRIEYPLMFPETLLDGQVMVQWSSDHPEILNAFGQISPEYMEEEGTLVQVKAVLTCQTAEATCIKLFRVYPKRREEASMFYSRVLASLRDQEFKTRQEEGFALPAKQDGMALQFRKEEKNELLLLSVLCLALVLLLYVWQDEKVHQAVKARNEQLLADYPEIVSKLTVLLRAGLTVKPALGKITADYRRRKERDGAVRYAYEELAVTYYEMANGVPEDKSYERFGRRCGLLPYMRLGGLLAQNVKKGNKSLLILLNQEAREALEERKRRAQKAGEKAGTRMLAPMILMLIVTIVILLYPAFSSFQI